MGGNGEKLERLLKRNLQANKSFTIASKIKRPPHIFHIMITERLKRRKRADVRMGKADSDHCGRN